MITVTLYIWYVKSVALLLIILYTKLVLSAVESQYHSSWSIIILFVHDLIKVCFT